jgi:Flp pilus assembly protein TadD
MNTALVIVLLYSLFGQPWVAAMVGLLFGLHPLTVEPIAWLGERKTLLAALFSLLCLILHVRHARRVSWTAYSACVTIYVLALMSKPTSTPLPALMLLLDFWPLRRLSRRAVLEKIPFFVIGAASALITVLSQARTAAIHMPGEYSAGRIPLTLCHNIVFYLWKIVWPAHLWPHYPFPAPFAVSTPAVLAGVVGTVMLIAALLVSLRWTRALLTGWLFFFVAIFPTMGVIGFTGVIAADKYAYLPSVGLMLSLTWVLTRFWGNRAPGAPPALRPIVLAGGVLIAAAAETFATRAYLGRWQGTETLFRHMLAAAPDSPVVHNDLGAALVERGKTDEAMAHFNQALELHTQYAEPYYNRGMIHKDKGDYDQAIADFTQAIRLKPQDAGIRNNRGSTYLVMEDFDRALADYSAAIELRPDYAEAYNNRGFTHGRRGEFEQAIRDLSRAIELAPDYAQAYNNRAAAYYSVRAYDRAWADVRACRRFGGTPAPQLIAALIEATGRSE